VCWLRKRLPEEAGVKQLVLNHLVPSEPPLSRFDQAREGFSGKFHVGKDLERFPIRLEGKELLACFCGDPFPQTVLVALKRWRMRSNDLGERSSGLLEPHVRGFR